MRRASTALILLVLLGACTAADTTTTTTLPPDREDAIPAERVKVDPNDDTHPPRSETSEYSYPVPLPHPVNTAGGEDSAFTTPDGSVLYFWFTPDVGVSAEDQVADGVTGIWRTERTGGGWTTPGRVHLQDAGKAALDGCEFVLDDTMWFCSAREGYTGIHWFTADLVDARWTNWQEADFDPAYEVGELHISGDGTELYFHSSRPGGLGEVDIWVSHRKGDDWGAPENVTAVNSQFTDGWPALSQDGSELWLTRLEGASQLYRSQRVDGGWGEPVLMFSGFAGEATLDAAGNVYFTHHYFEDGVMIEADIYVATRIG